MKAMMKNIFNFIENDSSAFIAGTYPENQLIYYNKKATALYGIQSDSGFEVFRRIFSKSGLSLEVQIKTAFAGKESCIFENVLTLKENGEVQLANVSLGYFDQEKTQVYLEINPKSDSRMEMAMYQLNQSAKAEAILQYDDQFSLYCCNQPFCDFLNLGRLHCLVQHGTKLGDILRPECKQELLKEMHDSLLEKVACVFEVEIRTTEGDWRWIRLYLQRREIDDSGEKIMCFIASIEEYKVVEETNQYFKAMQELTDDIFYRIEVDTMTLHHADIAENGEMTSAAIPDYLTTFTEQGVIHPDDVENYIKELEAFGRGEILEVTARFAIDGKDFQWYTVRGKQIFDAYGNIKEIWGRLICRQEVKETEQELSALNQLLGVIQEMDHDVIFRVDLKTMDLFFKQQVEPGIWRDVVVQDFFNAFRENNYVHPDDRERYFRLAGAYFNGELDDSDFFCEVRFALVTDYYVWYNIKCKKIYDKNGNATEVYGKLLNVETEKVMFREYSLLNQYFSAIQFLSRDILIHIDINGNTLRHSNSNALKVGIPVEIPDFMNTLINRKFIPEESAELYRSYARKLLAGEQMEFQIQLATSPMVYEWYNMKCQFIYNDKKKPCEIFGVLKNIQEHKDLENEANYDGLTSVRNIKSFESEVRLELEDPTIAKNHALVFIDMDDFKSVNDTFGHQFGDYVLETFATRLKNCVRDIDMVGRLGGDEFVIYLKGVFHEDMALKRAKVILEQVNLPIESGSCTHVQGASMGIALIPEEGISYEELYARADKAVYMAKKQGKNQVVLFQEP